MNIKLDDKYAGYPIYAQKIETGTQNPYFTNGDIAIQIYIEKVANLLDILEDGDFIVLKGGAGTKNDFHIAKLIIKGDTAYFEATSDFVKELSCEQIPLENIHQAPIYAKLLFTISNRMSQEMFLHFTGTTIQSSDSENNNSSEPRNFRLSLPSER